MADWTDFEPNALEVGTYVVLAGPHKGRICQTDDDEFLERSMFSESDLKLYDEFGVVWKKLRYQEVKGGEYFTSNEIGTACKYVTFGYYLHAAKTFAVPQQVLRPANMNDLVTRFDHLGNEIMKHGFGVDGYDDEWELISLLHEKNYVTSKMWEREKAALSVKAKSKNIFLCHSSADKPLVRLVYNDLSETGQKPWLDEFEIKVGDSIVEKVTAAHEKADALVIFLSDSSVDAPWVKREWQSALMRQLSDQGVRILPARLDEAKIPSILSDIKYADFRESYLDGLGQLLMALE